MKHLALLALLLIPGCSKVLTPTQRLELHLATCRQCNVQNPGAMCQDGFDLLVEVMKERKILKAGDAPASR